MSTRPDDNSQDTDSNYDSWNYASEVDFSAEEDLEGKKAFLKVKIKHKIKNE